MSLRHDRTLCALFLAMCLASGLCAQESTGEAERNGELLRQREQASTPLSRQLDSDGLSVDAASAIERTGWTVFPEPDPGIGRAVFSGPASPQPRYPTVHWSGFLQLDGGSVQQDDTNVATVGDVDALFGLRRVRLRAFGDIRPDTHYVVDLDFAASGHPSFRDVFLAFRSVPWVQNASFGYYKQPFGMDAETSGQELLLLERQLPFAFAPFRQTGIGIHGTDQEDTITWSASVYTFPTNSFGVGNNGNGLTASTRITALPFMDDASGRLVHLGIGYAVGDPSDNIVRYAIEPGFFVTDPATTDSGSVPVFVDTGDIPSRLFQLLNFEFAAAAGPFRWQSETRVAFVDQIGGPALAFSGTYFQLGLILTGERPDYDRGRAIFNRVAPDRPFDFSGGCGAWELAAGWSVIDLNDGNITGGKMYLTTIGLNWYLSEYTRLMLNLNPVLLDDATFGRSHAFVVGARFQASF